jgi:hypothetical protein
MATLNESDLIAESVPPPGVEEEGPPSAPRLREAPAEEPALDEVEAAEQEPEVTTPPPESGRHEVAQAAASADALDMDIAITVSDSTPPPPPAPEPVAPPAPVVEIAATPLSLDISGSQPRLALVSEPEINLHTPPATPPPAAPPALQAAPPVEAPPVEAPPPVVEPPPPASDRLDLVPESGVMAPKPAPIPAEEVELAVSVPDHPPAALEPVAASAPAERAISDAPPSEPGLPAVSTPPPALPTPPPAPPAVRLMVQPSPAPSAQPLEVWASTHAAPSLRGQVASFVGQNVSFAPKSFGEIVDASLELGK